MAKDSERSGWKGETIWRAICALLLTAAIAVGQIARADLHKAVETLTDAINDNATNIAQMREWRAGIDSSRWTAKQHHEYAATVDRRFEALLDTMDKRFDRLELGLQAIVSQLERK